MLIDTRTIQTWLKKEGMTGLPEIDGLDGPKTEAAVAGYLNKRTPSGQTKAWSKSRKRIAVEQLFLQSQALPVGEIDGFIGPQTQSALAEYINGERDKEPNELPIPTPEPRNLWPRERDVMAFYGPVGSNQTSLQLPYPMKLAWDTSTIIRKISIHSKVAKSAERALEEVLKHYGDKAIGKMGLDLFGGCLNVRKKRGGSSWSMHAWGIAIDIDPENNQLHWPMSKARMGKSEYEFWWRCWEKEGWVSLGRTRNFDAMHIQAARL